MSKTLKKEKGEKKKSLNSLCIKLQKTDIFFNIFVMHMISLLATLIIPCILQNRKARKALSQSFTTIPVTEDRVQYVCLLAIPLRELFFSVLNKRMKSICQLKVHNKPLHS